MNRSRDMKCFECNRIGRYANVCSNKKVMILLENLEIESEEERPLAETYKEEMDNPVHGELLVARRLLSVQSKPEEQDHRVNLFHT